MSINLQTEIEAAESRMCLKLLRIVRMEAAEFINDATAAILRRRAEIDCAGEIGFAHLVRECGE